MNRRFIGSRWAAVAGVVGALGATFALDALVSATGGASAANLQAISPASGGSATAFNLTVPASARCPKPTNHPSGDIVQSFVVDDSKVPVSQLGNLTYPASNTNLPTLGSYVGAVLYNGGSPYANVATIPETGQITPPNPFSWSQYANLNDFGASAAAGTDLYPGTFNIGLACVTSTGQTDGANFWAVQMTFSADPADAGGFTWKLVNVPTAVTISASPANHAAPGAAVTFTATVTPSDATGTVQFYNGSTPLGAAQQVAHANGLATATLVTGNLPTGSNSIKATFTPTSFVVGDSTLTNVYGASTSPVLVYTIGSSSPSTTSSPPTTAKGSGGSSGGSSHGGASTPGAGSGNTAAAGGSSEVGASGAATGTGAGDPSVTGTQAGSGPGGRTLAATGGPLQKEILLALAVAFIGLFVLSFSVPTIRRSGR